MHLEARQSDLPLTENDRRVSSPDISLRLPEAVRKPQPFPRLPEATAPDLWRVFPEGQEHSRHQKESARIAPHTSGNLMNRFQSEHRNFCRKPDRETYTWECRLRHCRSTPHH